MPTTLTAHGPEDLLAAVPVVLGFRPSQSLVMLTFGGRPTFHARVDLPEPAEPARAIRELADVLLAPALEHGVDRVAFVAYTPDARLAARLGGGLVQAFTRAGVTVIDVLRAHDRCWTSVPCRPRGQEEPLRPYDDLAHPFAAQAVFDGRVTRDTREELRTQVAPDPDLRRRTARAQLALPPSTPAEQVWVLELLVRCVVEGHPPDDDEAARVLRALTTVELRDTVLCAVSLGPAQEHLEFWSGLLRRAPHAQVAEAAAVTAFCAWRAGHGALAWCALDRCFEVEPGHPLGLALAECLVRAVPPSAWDERGPTDPLAEPVPEPDPGAEGAAGAGSHGRERPDAESGTA